jgi:CxxC motif-containing protein (DUF1111 family)
MKKFYCSLGVFAFLCMASCSDDDSKKDDGKTDSLPEWYYTGGELGTSYLTTFNAYAQPTPAVEKGGFFQSFKDGEQLFEKPYVSNAEGVRRGLGPVYVRSSCVHCHPGYGHGKRISAGSFNTAAGNGCLLVVYTPDDNNYVPWLAGMPQSHAVLPFKAPLDESKISVAWKDYTDDWGNKFPDGETYSLQYPEVTIPKEAIYVCNQGYNVPKDYEVRLESTIGVYGTGLLDAISDDDIKAQYAREEKAGAAINPAIFKNGEWVKQYANSLQGDGSKHPLRYTYALSRGPLLDGPGSNAMWNITNVTRSNRTYHYLDAAGTYALYSSKDPDVQASFPSYIAKVDPNKEHPEWWTNDVESNIKSYLTSKKLPVEMDDKDFLDFMVWHRGLAVPAARNVDDKEVLKGKELFEAIGCTHCHRPTWTTGDDNFYDPNMYFKNGDSKLPRYPNQKIWPYTDMVQHQLYMKNDIRGGWCRTTPLWGRGLHQKCTGSATSDRIHDCRARNVVEAIMWHGNEKSAARKAIEKFRNLSKDERNAIVKFIDSI